MKKSIFLPLLFFSLAWKSQHVVTYVRNSAVVTVQKSTLVYNGGGLEMRETSRFDNHGNVMVKGIATDEINLGDTANFNLKFTSSLDQDYGQLYITGIPQDKIVGKVNKEHLADYMQDTGRQQTGLPFYNFTILELVNVFGAGVLNVANSGRSNYNSAFWWNNARARFDHIAYSGSAYTAAGVPNPLNISPMTYYILPRRRADGTFFWNALTDKKIYRGTPASDVSTTNVQFALSGGFSGSFGANGTGINSYYEYYNTYVDDPFTDKNTTTWATTYGKNLYQMANPFLTNIDLKFISTQEEGNPNDDGVYISNLEGIAYYRSNNVDWGTSNGSTYSGTPVIVKTSGGFLQAGDVGTSLLLKPMAAFMVKLNSSDAKVLDFSKTRRFKWNSRATSEDYSVNAGKSAATTTNIPTDKIVKQVAVIMLNSNDEELDRTYYAVSPSAITGYGTTVSNQPTMQAYFAGARIFTKEEKTTGGEDNNFTSKLYINEANEIGYKSKKIPLYINYTDQPYKIKFEVFEKGERVADGLSNGKSFYYEDSEGNVFKIVDGDTVALNGNQAMGLYYEMPEEVLGAGQISKSQTIIAKKDSQWIVRFAKDWKNATVEIYSIAGQLINSKNQISTNNDYVIPVNSQKRSGFVVKAVSEKGEVVIKKIIN